MDALRKRMNLNRVPKENRGRVVTKIARDTEHADCSRMDLQQVYDMPYGGFSRGS